MCPRRRSTRSVFTPVPSPPSFRELAGLLTLDFWPRPIHIGRAVNPPLQCTFWLDDEKDILQVSPANLGPRRISFNYMGLVTVARLICHRAPGSVPAVILPARRCKLLP